MKICFLIADISSRGGTERATTMIANGLLGRKHEIDIISCKNKPESFFALDKKIRVHTLKAERIKNKFWRKMVNYIKIWKLVCDRKYDVIIAVDVYLYLYLFPVQIMRKSKCIAWEHFNCYVSSMKSSNLARALAVRFADKIVVLGKRDLNNYIHRYRNANNITFIYNPVAFEQQINRNISKHRVVAAGRLTEQKGFDLLIDAWNMIEKQEKDLDWDLDIYGEGNLESQLSDQINRYGLKRVHLKGYADNIVVEFLNASIFVLSSRYEGFGLVLIEALACGLPCVSFNCQEGPSEIINDRVNGFLVENGNVNQLSARLLELMDSYELRKEFSANAYNDLQRFDLQKVLNKWEKLLHEL